MKLEQPTKAIFITLVFIFLLMTIWIKVLGATEVPNIVERKGYCKSNFGEEWDFNEKEIYCYDSLDFRKEPMYFTEEEFRVDCPKNKFISLKFYSDCFHNGKDS